MNFKEYCENVLNESKESRDLMRKMHLVYVGYGIYKDQQGNKYKYDSEIKQMRKLNTKVSKNFQFKTFKKGQKVYISKLNDFSAKDYVMNDNEYKELINHNNKEAIIIDKVDSGYYDVKFEDGYYIDALSDYHISLK